MNYIIATILALAISIGCGAFLSPEERISPTTASDDPCGDPVTISQSYGFLSGRVIEVVDGGTFKLLIGKRKTKTVDLIGIKAPRLTDEVGKESREHMSALISNKPVTIYFSSCRAANDERISAQVSTAGYPNMSGVNLETQSRGCKLQT